MPSPTPYDQAAFAGSVLALGEQAVDLVTLWVVLGFVALSILIVLAVATAVTTAYRT